MTAAHKPYVTPVALSTPPLPGVAPSGSRPPTTKIAKAPMAYYTFDRHGDVIEIPRPVDVADVIDDLFARAR